MFHSSSKHLFDTIFGILCAMCIGTSSLHSGSSSSGDCSSNTNSKTLTFDSPSSGHNHQHLYQASFIDFILDPNLIGLLKFANKTDEQSLIQKSHNSTKATTTTNTASSHQHQQQSLCPLLSNLLNGNQMKFCHKHQDLLITILPQVIQLTQRECMRITSDLRWNCSAIDYLLDRSNPLAFTKEATLVRSILNAAMMYLVLKTCSDKNHHGSCGCRNQHDSEHDFYSTSEFISRARRDNFTPEGEQASSDGQEILLVGQHDLSQADLSKLDSGSPLRLTKSMIRRQVCLANPAFAIAFTKVFIDSDDNKALNRAYKILNEERNYTYNMSYLNNVKRVLDSDNKNLAYIKWSKSAINLHNNHAGRQMVGAAIQRRCRCHGLSGVCPFQTCWDHLLDFETITTRLRSIYLGDMTKVEVKNLGSLEKPDLSLTRFDSRKSDRPLDRPTPSDPPPTFNEDLRNLLSAGNLATDGPSSSSYDQINRIKPGELLYLYESPEYCEPLPRIRHPGTKGRPCAPMENMIERTPTKQQDMRAGNAAENSEYNDETSQKSSTGPPGSCEQLCCNRGCHRELVLDMVACDCRFKFCCEVKCDHCLRQRVQHFCL